MVRLFLAVGFWLLCSMALAQPESAAQLIERGVSLREAGRDEEALAVFQHAYAAEPSAQAMAQIALAEHALGHMVDAEAHLVEALASDTDRFVRRHRALLEQDLAEIRAQLTDLAVTADVAGAEVSVDGVTRGRLPLSTPLRVQLGTAHVEIHAPGYRDYARDVSVVAGRHLSLSVTLEPSTSTSTPVASIEASPETEPEAPVLTTHASSPSGTDAWRLPTGIALAAAGIVGIGVGAGLMAWREDNARARLTCSDTDPACRARYQTAYDAETAGITTLVVAGLLGAAGGALLVWDLLTHESTTERAAQVHCAPSLLGLACAGTF